MADNTQCSPRSGRLTRKPPIWFVSLGEDIRAKQEIDSKGCEHYEYSPRPSLGQRRSLFPLVLIRARPATHLDITMRTH